MSENDNEDVTGTDEPAENIPIEGTESDVESESETSDSNEELIERIEETSSEGVAREIGALRERAETAEQEVDEHEEEIGELESQLKRKQADFQNYKQRSKRRQEEMKERATEDLIERLLSVRDDLMRALSQDEETDIRSGVESTLGEFDRVLTDEGVTAIEPESGSNVDPQRHEVMLRVESDHPSETVAEVYRPGYEMGEKVLRPAQVTVSE